MIEGLPKRYGELLRKAEVLYIRNEIDKFRQCWSMANATISSKFVPEYNYDERMCDSQSAIWLFYTDEDVKEPYVESPILTKYAKQIAQKICTDLGLKIVSYKRIKANLLFNDFEFKEGMFNAAHKDFEEPDILSIVYYVDDSDGATSVFTEFSKENRSLGEPQRFEPIQGTAIALPANMYHASACPVRHNRRTVININVKIEKE